MVSRCNDVVPSEEHWNLGEHYGPGPPGKRNMGAGLGNDVFGIHVRAVVVMGV